MWFSNAHSCGSEGVNRATILVTISRWKIGQFSAAVQNVPLVLVLCS